MIRENPLEGLNNELPSIGQLRWNCRRGMKELEVLLIPFVDHCFQELPAAEQSVFAELLSYDDASLYSWFLGAGDYPSASIQSMVKKIQVSVGGLLSNPGYADSISL